ncbi:MAG: ABC transporter permease [Verrucomicrobiales bacterium]|nr:ABC transporter permease [Verrucomicrobiales bacterium]
MRTFCQDLLFGFRLLLNSPGLTAVAVLTLALGMAANTTVFSWIDGLLLRPFPGAAQGHQLTVLEMVTAGAPNGANQMSYLDYCDYRDNLKSLSGLAAHHEGVFSLGDDPANGQAVWGELVSGNYFEVLGVKPALGRVFTSEENGDKLGAYAVAVISHGLWRRRFHADPLTVGKILRVNQRELTIVGVASPEFRGTMPGLIFDIWVPVTMGKELGMLSDAAFQNRGNRPLYAVARLRSGVAITQARTEAATFSSSLETMFPDSNRGVSATILPVWEFHSAAPELLLKPLRILMAISVLVLLIVCANVANLLLARSVARRKELSIRMALGANGKRLGRQLLTETLLLASAGTLVGLLLAFWMADLLPALVPRINVPIALGFQLSARVLAFTVLACVAATLISGVAPALLWLRSDVNEALKEGGRSGNQGKHSHKTRGVLVIAEVALATVGLIGAGLFVKSFRNARKIDPGFDRSNVVLARFHLAGTGFSTAEVQQFCLRLRDRLRSNPGVASVSYANQAPLGASAGPYTGVDVEGYVPALGESRSVNYYLVAPGYFGALRLPLLEGRDFKESDDGNSMPVVIVNESFARRYFPETNPLGRRVRCFGKWATVVGLAEDSKYFNIAEAPRPHFFAPFRQQARVGQQLFFFIKVDGPPNLVAAALRREVAAVDPKAAAFDVMPLVEWTEVTLLPQKVAANLLAALGLIALILAAVGLYSVMAYAVSQRTREIGIRMALGAQPRSVLGDVLRRGMTLTAAGLGLGIAAALAVTRLVESMLVNVSPTDLGTFAVCALFLASITLLASLLPARRATKVDPMAALRCE